MQFDWYTTTLKDAGVTLIDCDHKTPKAQETGMPYIGIPQLKEGHIIPADARLITEEDFHHWRRKAKPVTNDVILSRRCNPGVTAYVPAGLEIALGQNLVLLRTDGKILYPPFLRWVVQGPNWWGQVSKYLNVGAVFESLRCAHIPSFEVKLPPLPTQKKIAHILSTLDDKIELNRKMNQTLEEMAQALFKSWFVDFDPVYAKVNAAGREGALGYKADAKSDEALERATAELGISKEILELFPSEFVESEMGMIPKGWEVKPISEVSSVAIGKTPPRKEPQWFTTKNNDIKWISIKDMGNNGMYIIETNEYLTKEAIEKFNVKVIPANTVLLSFKLTLGRVSITTEEMTSNEAIAHFVLEDGSLLSTEYIYCYLKNFDYSMLGSTSSIATAINSKIVKTIPTIVATETIIKMFNRTVNPMFKQILSLTKEIQTLENTRDTLLPKFLSGELDVSNIEVDK